MKIKIIYIFLLYFLSNYFNKVVSQNVTIIPYNYVQNLYVYPKTTDPNNYLESQFCTISLEFSAYDILNGIKDYIKSSLVNEIDIYKFTNGSHLFVKSLVKVPIGPNTIISTFKSNNINVPDGVAITNVVCLSTNNTLSLNSSTLLKFNQLENSFSSTITFNNSYDILPPQIIYAKSDTCYVTNIIYMYTRELNGYYYHTYRISLVGIKTQVVGMWMVKYNLHNRENSIGLISPINDLNKTIIFNSITKYGLVMNSYYSFPQIFTSIINAVGSTLDHTCFLMSNETINNYFIPTPILGYTQNPQNITYMVISNSRNPANYIQYFSTYNTLYNSSYSSSEFVWYLRSNSNLLLINNLKTYSGNDINIASITGKIISNKPAEHLLILKYGDGNFSNPLKFPYGYGSGNFTNWELDLPVLKYENKDITYDIIMDNNIGSPKTILFPKKTIAINSISILNIEFTLIPDKNGYSVVIDYNILLGLSHIKIMLLPLGKYKTYHFDKLSITNGDLYFGRVEFIFENFDTIDNLNYDTFNVYIYDLSGASIRLIDGFYYPVIKVFKIPNFDRQNLEIGSISSISFSSNVVSNNAPSSNKMYVFCDNIGSTLILTIKPQLDKLKYYGIWSNSNLRYEFDYNLPANILGGSLNYTISTPKSNLIYGNVDIVSSVTITGNGFDLKGPVIQKMIKINNGGSFGYNITIKDDINGFDNGYIILMGSLDGSKYNFSFENYNWNSGSNVYLCSYDIVFNRQCVEQTYFISELYLVDLQGINSTFYNPTFNDYYQTSHPWSEYISDPTIDQIPVSCNVKQNPPAFIEPYLKNLTISKTFVNVLNGSSDDRTIEFKLDIGGDFLEDHSPIIYLTSSENQILSYRTSYIVIDFLSYYGGFIEIPKGFGYPIGIAVSVYGLISNTGTFKGYSNSNLQSKNITNFIQVHQNFGPIPFGFSEASSQSSQSSSNEESSSNNPPKCNKDCGLPYQGYCENNICKCIQPWYGEYCSQKIIIFPKPNQNETSPTTVIFTNPTNETKEESIRALINIIQIREIEIDNNEFKRYSLLNWTLTVNETNSNHFLYNTKIQTNDKQFTNINVSIEYYLNETNIEFADIPIIIKPSSVKYTISLDRYSFNNKLNYLELIMNAEVKSNQNDYICSQKSFNENDEIEDYINLSVGHISMVGRFIKRGIVDNEKIISISNKMLNEINQDSNDKSQSYISIKLPNYENNIIVDPDFSILLDTKTSASNICKLSNNKLSTTKIAGIIIGCVGLSIIIIASVIYTLYRKKQKQSLKNKIRNIELEQNK